MKTLTTVNIKMISLSFLIINLLRVVSAAPAAGEQQRPWLLNLISSAAVDYIASYRSPNFEIASASAVAKEAVDGAIAAPQITELVNSAEAMFIRDREELVPSDVLKLAQDAHVAYGDMKQSAGFSNYLHYVALQAKHYDVNKMLAPPANNNAAASRNQAPLTTQIQQMLMELERSATGREALQSVNSLVQQIAKDVDVTIPSSPRLKNSE